MSSRTVYPTTLDRFVPLAGLLAAISTLLIIFFGRW
jgi:hypothetical protein